MMSPVRVALINDYMLVVRGLARMLEPYSDRVEVVELAVRRDASVPVDIALYDTFSQAQVDAVDVDRLLGDPDIDALAVFTWNMHEALVEQARAKGVRGYLSKSLSAPQLVEALERIAAGETVVEPASDIGSGEIQVSTGDWPGRHLGLSPRQAEVLALVTQGLSNEDISRKAYLSVNTVKSYLRQAYRTIGVSSRTQAILWGIDHGMALEPSQTESTDTSDGTED